MISFGDFALLCLFAFLKIANNQFSLIGVLKIFSTGEVELK